jgi:hypothetical protein
MTSPRSTSNKRVDGSVKAQPVEAQPSERSAGVLIRPVRRDGNVAMIFDQYTESFPSNQNAVDAVPGWSTALPGELGVTAGAIALFDDGRITWAMQEYGDIKGRRVLELGPLEAGHTYMLTRAGAHVEAIESNRLAYLRCLVVKELVGMQNARFLLGDFVKWLERTEERYDLIIASGVLYHMRDPLHLLDLISKRSDTAFFWTHYVSDAAMPATDSRRSVIATDPEVRDFHGVRVRQYRRTYANAQQSPAFCGGSADEHYWIEREDILAGLAALGYTTTVAHDEPDHHNGPAFSVLARRDPQI